MKNVRRTATERSIRILEPFTIRVSAFPPPLLREDRGGLFVQGRTGPSLVRRGARRRTTFRKLALGIAALGSLTCQAEDWPAPSQHVTDPAPTSTQTKGNNFKTLKTDHFAIRYDTSDETIRPLVIEMEKTYDAVARFCVANKLGSLPQGTRLDIIVFEQPEAFKQHLAAIGIIQHSVAGLYDHRSNVAAFLNVSKNPDIRRIEKRIALLQDQLHRQQTGQRDQQTAQDIHSLRAARDKLILAFNRLVIRHETAHQVLFNFGVHQRGAPIPSWVTEGLACQFEIPQNDSGQALGEINHARLADFREALRLTPATQSVDDATIDRAITTGRLLVLPELIADRTSFESDGPNAPFRYAQSWALVHYIIRTRPNDFARYLRHLSERNAGETTDPRREWTNFTSFFGKPDSDFQRSGIEYILSVQLDPTPPER